MFRAEPADGDPLHARPSALAWFIVWFIVAPVMRSLYSPQTTILPMLY
jgi:hypothetical protein